MEIEPEENVDADFMQDFKFQHLGQKIESTSVKIFILER